MGSLTDGNGWNEYQKLVLDKLEKNDQSHVALAQTLEKMHIDLAGLKVRSSLAGAIAGFLASAAVAVAVALLKFIK